MSCFICQAFGENSPSNPQLAQECPATPLSILHSLHHIPIPPLTLLSSPPLHFLSIPLPSPAFLSLSPHRVPFYPSARLFRDGSLEGAGAGGTGRSVPKLTNCSLQTQRVAVEMGSHMAKLDLLTLSPLRVFFFFHHCSPLSLAPPRHVNLFGVHLLKTRPARTCNV